MADEQSPQNDTAMKRRGLFAAAAALFAGIVARVTEAPVTASSGGGDQGALALGSNPWYIGGSGAANTPAISSAPTVIQASANFSNFAGFNGADKVVFEADARPSGGVIDGIRGYGSSSGGTGVYGSGPSVGLWGAGAFAVYGNGTDTGVLGAGPTGVSGSGTGAGTSTGVSGTGNTYGVYGSGNSIGVSGTGGPTGVRGQGTGNAILGQVFGSSANTVAVYGQNSSTNAGGSPGAGGFGVYGISAKGHGLVGATGSAGAAAVVGAANGVAGAYAGVFYGPVAVGGPFTVVGASKSAAVPHPDGTLRRLYCMESPESWFEDFGKGRLECGRADITIDPDFAVLVDLSDSHVFLTEKESHHHLIVREQTPNGFSVEADLEMAALKGKSEADLNGTFSWRLIAKRKDIKGERLETVTIPPEPTLPPLPDIEIPTPPLISIPARPAQAT
jgi:hypothetical protein